jgi:protocatechuate 3,4-dioxygenase, beta subunit
VYGKEQAYSKISRQRELAAIGQTLQLKQLALTFVPSFNDRDSDVYLNKVNQGSMNTFLVYRRSNIIANYVNLQPSRENLAMMLKIIDQRENQFFYMPGAQ